MCEKYFNLIRTDLFELKEFELHKEVEDILGTIYSHKVITLNPNYFYPDLYEQDCLNITASFVHDKDRNFTFKNVMSPIKEEVDFETSVTSFTGFQQ